MPVLQLQKEIEKRRQEAAELEKAIATRLDAKQKQLASERSSLEAQVQEATAPAAALEVDQAALAASLASEVEQLRCDNLGVWKSPQRLFESPHMQ